MDLFTSDPKKVSDLSEIWKHEYYVDTESKDNIRFQESLIIGRFVGEDKIPTPIGSLCLNIQRGHVDIKKLVVYVRTQLDFDGRVGGSKITAWLDPTLRTIEEKRVEYVTSPSTKQSLYVAVQKENLLTRHEVDSGERIENSFRYPLGLARQLVCEGANFALMRLLAVHKYVGQFETVTLYLNGDICRNIYMCLGPESGMVNGNKMDVCKIFRKIIEQCGIIHICETTLTVTGRIISHEWKGCDYVMYINPMIKLTYYDSQEKINWGSDLQLFSLYLDKKEICLAQAKSYLNDRSDIKRILADYVQNILQMKPDDVLDFTMEYFSRFSSH